MLTNKGLDRSGHGSDCTSMLKDALKSDDAIMLSKMLRASTRVGSNYEDSYKRILIGCGVTALYEPLALHLRHESHLIHNVKSYTPDFLLPFNYIKGKPIVIEPHAEVFLDVAYLDKLRAIRDEYGLYMVVASYHDEYSEINKVDSRIIRTYRKEFVDELWFEERHNRHYYSRIRIIDVLKKSQVSAENALNGLAGRSEEIRKECRARVT